MAISGPASYVPTTSDFVDHWTDVNTALGAAGPLVLRKESIEADADATVATLDGLYNQLRSQHQTLQGHVIDVDLARGTLEDLKSALLARFNMFNERVRADLGNTKWERALPQVPGLGAGQGAFTEPLNGALALWSRIDSDHALGANKTLKLRDGTPFDDFEGQIGQLDPTYRALNRAERTLKLEREERNEIQNRIYPILKQFRVAVPGYFAPEHPLVTTLPRLTPEPGHTPEPVEATATWDAAAGKAKITWEASEDEGLDHYEVRHSPGSEYHEDVEDVLGRVEPDEAREFLTSHALGQPGAKALFRVVVVLGTGNERGSATLAVTRPP